MAPTIMHNIGPKIDISFEISQFYFPVSKIRKSPFELIQIGAKKLSLTLNLGSLSDRVKISFRSALGRSVCPGLSYRLHS